MGVTRGAKEAELLANTRGREKKRGKVRRTLGVWILLLPAVIVLYLMIWRPTVMGVVWSFFRMKGYTPVAFVGLENYIGVLTNTDFPQIMSNTVQYVFWSFVIGFIPPFLIAFFINEMVNFKNLFRISIYMPAIMPGVTVLLLWYFIYSPDQTGLLNQVLALFGKEPYVWLNDGRFTIVYIIIQMTWAAFPGTMFLYYTNLQNIPTELYEAATIDGAGFWKKFIHVSVPQMSGLLLLNVVNQIIGVFQVMQQPMVLTGGGPNGASTSLGYQMYLYGFVQGRVGQALALGVITFVILLIVTVFYFKLNKTVEGNL